MTNRVRFAVYCLFLAGAVALPFAVSKVFLATPIEAQMGTAQKIFYFHVPLAWAFMLFTLICGIAAAIELRKGSLGARALAVACAELAVLCGLGVLLTGPIWGDATWGKPWTGDARQVTTALSWLMVVAYVLLRRYGPSHSERLSAGLAVFSAVLVPVIYYAVKVWKTMHPDTTVVGSLPAEMWASFWPALFGLLAITSALMLMRYTLERQVQSMDRAWIAADREHAATMP
jgi:heme exporter protein C